MISKVYGIHKVIFYRKKQKMSKKIYFCIMDNVFATKHKIDLRYDLKGSTFGRRTIKDKTGIKVDRTVALKDCDFLDRKESFRVGKENRKKILEIIKQDSQFFAQNEIIDYSLLIGISNRAEHPSAFLSQRNSQVEMMVDTSPMASLNNSIASINDVAFY